MAAPPSTSRPGPSARIGDLFIELTGTAPVMRVDWRGRSNDLDPGPRLGPFLADVTRRARDASTSVEMHFEALEFFNSSTITVIIQYAKELRTARIKLAVFYNPHHKWQKIFFDALSMFEKGDGLLKIHTVR
jgi:hypothetical protein